MDIGKRITYFRTQKGLTTNKLANLAGISQSFLRDVELSKKGITVENLILVCEAMQISIQDFFNETESEISFSDTEVLAEIKKLTPEQQNRLISFLKSL